MTLDLPSLPLHVPFLSFEATIWGLEDLGSLRPLDNRRKAIEVATEDEVAFGSRELLAGLSKSLRAVADQGGARFKVNRGYHTRSGGNPGTSTLPMMPR